MEIWGVYGNRAPQGSVAKINGKQLCTSQIICLTPIFFLILIHLFLLLLVFCLWPLSSYLKEMNMWLLHFLKSSNRNQLFLLLGYFICYLKYTRRARNWFYLDFKTMLQWYIHLLQLNCKAYILFFGLNYHKNKKGEG